MLVVESTLFRGRKANGETGHEAIIHATVNLQQPSALLLKCETKHQPNTSGVIIESDKLRIQLLLKAGMQS